MTTQFFKRPSANYAGEAGLPNRTKYYTDSTSSPKVPISSTKVDGDINYLIDAVNALYDTAVSGVVGDGSITNVKLRDSGACSVIGRAANSSGTPADISAATNGTVLVRKSNQVQFSTIPAGAFETGSIATSDLADTAVSFGKIQNVSTGVVLGRSSSGAGPVEALTAGTGISVSSGSVAITAASDTAIGGIEIATTAETQTGTDATRAVTPAGLKGALGVSRTFESAEQSLQASLTYSAAHGLGAIPLSVQVVLRCKTAEQNYSVGDEVPVSAYGLASNNNLNAWASSTNVGLVTGTNFLPTFALNNKTTAAAFLPTPANWRFVVRAWA